MIPRAASSVIPPCCINETRVERIPGEADESTAAMLISACAIKLPPTWDIYQNVPWYVFAMVRSLG